MMEYDNNVQKSGLMSLFNLTESATGAKLQAAMFKARQEFRPLAKSGINSYFKSGKDPHRFSTLKDVEDAIGDAFGAHGLAVRHQVIAVEIGDALNNALRTTIEHGESGEFISSIIAMEQAGGPQQTGSQITYYRRYNLISLLNLEADDEDDGNLAQGNKGRGADEIQTKNPSRSYEVFDLDGKVSRTYTDWASFKKAIDPINKFSHSATWCAAQSDMLDDVIRWAASQKDGANEKTSKALDGLSKQAADLKGSIEKEAA